jgi:hypothetical protein
MRKFPSLLTLAFLFLTFAAIPKSFAEEWPPITPEDLKMTSIAEQPGAPAVILFRRETDDDIKHIHTFYERIKILTEAGRSNADVEIPYLRHTYSITDISGRTIQPDGTVEAAKGRPLDKLVEKERGRKVHIKVFSLPNAQVGSILDIRYTLTYDDHSFWAPEWHVQEDLFQKKAVFKFIPYLDKWQNRRGQIGQGVAWTPYIPAGQPQPALHTRPPGFTATRGEYGDSVDLEMENVPALVREPYMPPRDVLRWRVDFYYRISEKPEDFWKDEGKYWNREVDSFINHKEGVDEVLTKVLSPADTPALKVSKLYSYISNLENRSFIPQRTIQEQHTAGFTENKNVTDVLKQKSGTHDDLNRSFVALVRAAGIPAWMMRVTDRGEYIFQPAYLSTDQFDGEIAIVQLDGKDMFLDPGTRFCPYGMLPWHYSGVDGPRQSDAKGAQIGTAAAPSYKNSTIQRKAILTLANDGTEEGTVEVGFFGLEAMDRRQQAALTDTAGKKKLLEDEIKSWLPGGTEVTISQEPRWDDTAIPLIAEFKVNGPLATSAGKRRIVPVNVFEINESPKFPAAERVNPIYFYDPSAVVDEVHLTLPAGTAVESLPKDDSVQLSYALYKTTHKMDNPTTLIATRSFIMGAIAIPKDNYKEIKDFYDKVSTGDGQQILLKTTDHAEGN